jgi:hypothetical protein
MKATWTAGYNNRIMKATYIIDMEKGNEFHTYAFSLEPK